MPNRDVPSNTWHLPALPTDIRQMFIDAVSQSGTLGQSIELVGHASGPGPLSQVVLALDVESVVLRLDLDLGEIDRGTRGGRAFAYTNPTIRITKKDGSSFLFDKLSHGQKRLFGLYWYLAASPQVFIADELSNGLHYTMVERILKEEIGKRQCFLALQDPLLLYNATFDDLDHVKRRFVICELSEEGGLEWWTWRQLRDDEATEFFEGYQAGIEHVPDILRSRGLW